VSLLTFCKAEHGPKESCSTVAALSDPCRLMFVNDMYPQQVQVGLYSLQTTCQTKMRLF
jgi:hypothetical protein